jgi:hypothetical protein
MASGMFKTRPTVIHQVGRSSACLLAAIGMATMVMRELAGQISEKKQTRAAAKMKVELMVWMPELVILLQTCTGDSFSRDISGVRTTEVVVGSSSGAIAQQGPRPAANSR